MATTPSTTSSADSTFVLSVAMRLAPEIRFHSKDEFGPCSIEWLLSRSNLTQGMGDLTWALEAKPIYLPSSMSILKAGPLQPSDLVAASSSSSYGGGENKGIGLWPMEAPAGQSPTYSQQSESFYFSDYQRETLRGELNLTSSPTTAKGAACYVHITYVTESDFTGYLINYYFFCAYNGAMGGTSWEAPPLAGTADGGGFQQHFGDIMRVAARVTVDSLKQVVTLHGVEFDEHGTTTVRSDGPFSFSNLPFSEVPHLTVYSAWHSHEMYWEPGKFNDPAIPIPNIVHDYTDDDGLHWQTWGSLVFTSAGVPAWINYNGLIGNSVHYSALSHIAEILTTGPAGPAFKSDWVRGQECNPTIAGSMKLITGDSGGTMFQLAGDIADVVTMPPANRVTMASNASRPTACIQIKDYKFNAFLSTDSNGNYSVGMGPDFGQIETCVCDGALAAGTANKLAYFLPYTQFKIGVSYCVDGTWTTPKDVVDSPYTLLGGIAAAYVGSSEIHLVFGVCGRPAHVFTSDGGTTWSPQTMLNIPSDYATTCFSFTLVNNTDLHLVIGYSDYGERALHMKLDTVAGTWSAAAEFLNAKSNLKLATIPGSQSSNQVLTVFTTAETDQPGKSSYQVTCLSLRNDGNWTPEVNIMPDVIDSHAICGFGAMRNPDDTITLCLSPWTN